jgi:hypothetical protein
MTLTVDSFNLSQGKSLKQSQLHDTCNSLHIYNNEIYIKTISQFKIFKVIIPIQICIKYIYPS